ncbi:ATPase H(+)-transporting accessory protein 2 isoform X2 [Maniola hyperantus]|uniref:ATPase H(+)-transporting accessory protein 2 isoform X2 n=1 Tax=Aphantopus hyperantus TaxID=2795564 RepID=UPI0015681B57|nr:ATPase H(+)-transporting accessory protein 2 isoform X2 [Maniola hyperantus]
MTDDSLLVCYYYFSGKMGGTIVFFWVTLAISAIGSNASGEFNILHSPESLKFSGSSKTLESLLKEIYSASLGMSVEENADWNGLTIVDPFNNPEAVLEVYIDGVPSLGETAGLKTKKFPLIVDEYEPDTYDAVRHRIKQRFTNGGNNLVNIRLSDPDDLASVANVFGKVVPPKLSKQTYQYLKLNKDNEEDYLFLYELEVLKLLTAKVNSGAISADNIVDYYNIRFSSLHALSDYHGPNSMQTKEAKNLLAHALQELSDAFVKAYSGSVLVSAVTTDVAHTRRVRAAPELRADKLLEEDNYTADYAAIFNIILWFSVVFAFALVAIVYAIMDMDPGRDSIIYRMTSTRMKKDN